MKTFMQKRYFSYYTYKNMNKLNEEFKSILEFLQKENKKKKYKILNKEIKITNFC